MSFHLHNIHKSNYFFTQTLNVLNLQLNHIGEKGAEHLSAALRNNTVSRIFSSSTQKTQIDFFTQTLTKLNLWNNQIGDKGAEHLSAALRNNTVSRIFSSSTQKSQIDFFTQTLTKLNLWNNQIGDKGAEHLSAALRNNTVSRIFSCSAQKAQIDFFTQTLTELNLWNNQIGEKGAEHLSAALRNNTVSRIFSCSAQKAQIDFFTQTLTELNLWNNQIGEKGAEHLSAALRNNTVSRIFSCSAQKAQIDFFTQTLTILDLTSNRIGNKLINEVNQLIERNRRNEESWIIELCLALKTVTEWRFFFYFCFTLLPQRIKKGEILFNDRWFYFFFIVVRREDFAFCSTDRIKRLIDFHCFLSKQNNKRSQLYFHLREMSFVFCDEGRKFFISWENISLKWFSLRELILLDNSAHWQICSEIRTRRWKSRLSLTDFIFGRSIDKSRSTKGKMFVSSTNSLWEKTIVVVKWKTRQETNRCFVALLCRRVE